MPVTKSAKKKLRQDRKREKANDAVRNLFANTLKIARKKPSKETVSKATKIIDKLAKKHIIHKNKASRLKASLSKLIKGPTKSTIAKPAPKSSKSKAKSKAK